MGYRSGVGREAPAFSLPSQDGTVVALKDYRGDWSPVVVLLADAGQAEAAVAALTAALPQLWGMRSKPVLIVAGPADATLIAAAGAQFPVLADPQGEVARRFGAWSAVRARPQTATAIVDKSGKIVWMGEGSAALDTRVWLDALQSVVV